MTPKECAKWNCDVDMSIYAREQVGSSFKPYVLSAAVEEGMNVQNQHPERQPESVRPAGLRRAHAVQGHEVLLDERVLPEQPERLLHGRRTTAARSASGDPKKDIYGVSTVQNALAQSSNTAFTDLAHRVTTTNDHSDGAGLRREHLCISAGRLEP